MQVQLKFQLLFLMLLVVDMHLLTTHASSEDSDSSSSSESSERRPNRDRPDRRDKNKFKCPSKKGIFADIEDCSRFYECKNWKAQHKRCQRSQLFDKYRKKCIPFIFAVCDDGKGEPDKKPKDEFKCPSKKGSFANIEDCSLYYVCKEWKHKQMKCPGRLLFDKYKKKCTPSKFAVCDDGKDDQVTGGTTPSDEKITTIKDDKFTCPSLVGNFPHPEDCSLFYSCTFFMPSLKSCKKGTLFDAVKKDCQPEDKVHCGSRRRPNEGTTAFSTPTPAPPTTKSTTTAEPTTTTVEPTTTEEPTTTQEPTTTEDPTTTEEPTTTPEPTTPTPEPTGPPETDCAEDDLDCIITETGETPKWFKCPVDMGSFPHPSSKKLFIFCINWKPSAKKCGQNRVFSEKAGTCVEPTSEA